MATTLPFRLTLASGSKDRRRLLAQAGYTFDVLPADIEEPRQAEHGSCQQYVQHVCWLKAAAVVPKVTSGIVLTADTVAWLDEQVIGKPDDRADAGRIIRWLSGRVHELWTGVCLWRVDDGFQICWQERTLLQMRSLSEVEVESYLDTNLWVGASGAYSIQDQDDPYLSIIEGSTTNVIGLPMESLEIALQKMAHW